MFKYTKNNYKFNLEVLSLDLFAKFGKYLDIRNGPFGTFLVFFFNFSYFGWFNFWVE